MKLDAYTIVLLRRPPDAPDLPEAALDALQQGHLGLHARLRDEGKVLVNGPFMGQPDESLRGIVVYRTSVEEARSLAEQDPSVHAGRLALDVFTWLVPEGALGERPAETVEID
jgi:uncharacterized protein